MQDWLQNLMGDPFPWLLEPDYPFTHYWWLMDILDQPADESDVKVAHLATPGQPLVRKIFARQHPGGYWGEDETKPYMA